MKSSRFHASTPLRLTISLCCIALLGLASGCSDDGGGEDNCHDEAPPPTSGFPDDAIRLASARVEMRADYTSGGVKNESTMLNLSMVDLSTLVVQSRFPSPCCGSMACFSLTGSLAETCRGTPGGACGAETCGDNQVCVNDVCVACARQPLDAEQVTISGLASGSVVLESPAAGAFVSTSVTPPLFGSEMVTIDVTGRDEPGYFPTYSQSIEPPDALEILSPDPTAPGPAGMTDLPLKWKAGNGDWMEVTLRSSNPDVTDKVLCVALDDGCATIPVGALETIMLDMAPDERVLMTVQRLRSVTDTVASATATQLKVSSRVDLALEQ